MYFAKPLRLKYPLSVRKGARIIQGNTFFPEQSDYGIIWDRLEPTLPPANLLDNYVACLKNKDFITYTKYNHGLWERLVEIDRQIGLDNLDAIDPEQAKKSHWKSLKLIENGFLKETLQQFKEIEHFDERFHFALSAYSFPGGAQFCSTPETPVDEVFRYMQRYVPERFLKAGADGLEFKAAVINGDIIPFLEALLPYRIVVIGPNSTRHFATLINAPNAQHYLIHDREARARRESILAWLLDDFNRHAKSQPTVYLVQGGALAFWLAAKAHPYISGQAFFFDLGMVLNLACVPRLVRGALWSKVFAMQILNTIERIHPGWTAKPEAYEFSGFSSFVGSKSQENGTPPEQNYVFREYPPEELERFSLEFNTGRYISSQTRKLFPQRPPWFNPARGQKEKVDFIESKQPDYSRVQTFLSLCERENHWANGGPVTRLLEQAIEEELQIHPERAAVMCSSGTTALHALVGLENYKAGRPLRWVVSAFGFFSTYVGPLSDAIIIDCDERGMLSLEQLSRLPVDSYDGIIVTNIFGLYPDFSDYQAFCSAHNKRLLIDNATGLLDAGRDKLDAPNEMISFHHTKPWGTGEGGCAIVSREDVDIVRGLINFGVGLTDKASAYALNGKISDHASAFILDRFERLATWGTFYERQRKRIYVALQKLGLPGEAFGDLLRSNTPSNSIPWLLDSPVPAELLENDYVVLRKYYKPAPGDFPQAQEIYSRIINIPVHPEMASLSFDDLNKCFCHILGRFGQNNHIADRQYQLSRRYH